jgi:hypothetical protein
VGRGVVGGSSDASLITGSSFVVYGLYGVCGGYGGYGSGSVFAFISYCTSGGDESSARLYTFLLFLPIKKPRAINASTISAAPTPIPADAPADNPEDEGALVGVLDDVFVGVVELELDVDVEDVLDVELGRSEACQLICMRGA